MSFAVFDHDSLVEALQSVWDQIAPSAMFTASANIGASRYSENFQNALDMIKWNNAVSDQQQADSIDGNYQGSFARTGYGFSYGTSNGQNYTNAIDAQVAYGSNNSATIGSDGYVDQGTWDDTTGDPIYVPAGFSPIRGENVLYADTLPPFDITLTFGSEYGHTAFQKIYDVDILNESSGASVDTVVMTRQLTWIARRLSPLIRGVYSRDKDGTMNPKQVNSVK